jgi:hypothetical protein
MSLLNSVSGQNSGKTDLNFGLRVGLYSGSPEYQIGRKLSHLSDGPSNGSKQLVICELRCQKLTGC